MAPLTPGLVGESTTRVTDELTAARYASGLVAAYATPAMVGLIESAAVEATRGHLPPGDTTVGIDLNIRHLAATPVGMSVHARAELVNVDGRRLDFRVEAWDDAEKIGEGTHTRMVVNEARFKERCEKKGSAPRS
jgi:fluoroacetyl-CoA thioesterase